MSSEVKTSWGRIQGLLLLHSQDCMPTVEVFNVGFSFVSKARERKNFQENKNNDLGIKTAESKLDLHFAAEGRGV